MVFLNQIPLVRIFADFHLKIDNLYSSNQSLNYHYTTVEPRNYGHPWDREK